VHVIDEALFTSMLHIFTQKESQEELLRESIQVRLDEMAREAKQESGLTFHTRIEKGKIYECVAKIAEEMNAAFVIMGTLGESTLRKKFIGSNAVRVINEAPCPVITIKGKEHREGCKTIVLPLDLSKETKEKVDKCIEIAKFFNSEVKVVTVVNTKDEFLLNKLERQMKQVVDFIQEAKIKCSSNFLEDSGIAERIIEFAEGVKADLIMIMTQQELVWTEYFIGTESQKIINQSEIPVCSIRPVIRKDTMEYVIS
jgi:nucleotide-binding universal stress UspA family protein